SARERVRERPADEERVRHGAERAARLELVLELHVGLAEGEADGLSAVETLLEDLGDEALVGVLDDALRDPAPARRNALPDDLRARLRPVVALLQDAPE